ncbi:MAG: tripartite tricarboxylate transporter substrate-binding protein [Pseudorhodoplanes sp.]|uniref:tripartite tricarboxylate transporter substrate-binding protein n=1 Tax=Pseudorhodoplanes sp. TaxID=1934341 RepID=UPI003D0D67BF
MTLRRTLLLALTAALAGPLLGASHVAYAQKPPALATIIVGFPAGGATDTVARLVAEAIQGKYADSVVVQNRPGAGGQIAAAFIKGTPADGTTLLFTPAFPMAIHPHVYKDMRYDTLKDFVPVATTHFGTLALSVGPAVPNDVKTLTDFIAWAKANPDKANFGAPSGGSQHFTGLMLARDANIKLNLISYKGGAPSVVDALGGHVPAIVTPLAEVLPHARDGKLRILATTARERSTLAPDIPTFVELGFDKIVVQDWSGFLMPAGTPPEVVARANAAISAAVESPKVMDAMAKLGMEVGTRTPAAFADTVRESWERYRDIVKESGLKAQ